MLDEYAILLSIAVAVISLIPMHFLDVRWRKKNPEKLGFAWGYWVVSSVFIGYVLLGSVILSSTVYDRHAVGRGNSETIVLIFAFFLVVSTYFAYRRHPLALIIITVLSFNILWIIINYFYLRNRWDEFKEESKSRFSQSKSTTSAKHGKVQSSNFIQKEIRVACFSGLVWATFVFLYGGLTSHYGSRISASELLELTALAFWPAFALVALTVVYVRFIK